MAAVRTALRVPDYAEDPPSTRRVLACSYAASTLATCTTYPLDTIKTRLQTYHYRNFWQCIVQCYRNEGVLAFYRGIPASLLCGAAARSLTMSAYAAMQPWLATALRPLGLDRREAVTLLSGWLAGASSTLFTCPFEFAKVASQVEMLVYRARSLPEPASKGTIRAVRDLCARGGVLSLYGGLRYQLARDSFGSAIYFSVYEGVKRTVNGLLSCEKSPRSTAPQPLAVAIGGGLCGVISWIAIYPIDTMKSKFQRDLYTHSLAPTGCAVLKPQFCISLSMYRGLGFSILRTSINGMMLFSSYEYLMTLSR